MNIDQRRLLLVTVMGGATPPTISSAAPANPVYGVAYSHQYTATGSLPFTWAVIAGALPAGLTLDANTGELAGTPTAAGIFSWTVTATGAGGTATQAASVIVRLLELILGTEAASIIECYPQAETSGLTATGAKNGFDGTYSANIALNAITFPDGSGAPLYDANSEHVQLPAASLDSLWADGIEGTVLLWLKVSAAGVWTDGVSRIGGTIGVDANNRIFFNKSSVNNRFDVFAVAGGTSKQVATTSLSYTTWFCVAATWNKAADRMRAFINGAQVGSTLTGLGTFTTTALANGFCQISNSSTTFYWPGYSKYLTVWNKELTPTQIAALAPASFLA